MKDVRVGRHRGGRWARTVESWRVEHPLAKLRPKYSNGGTLLFDHYVFHHPHRRPDRFTLVDMMAVDRLMSGNLSARRVRWACVATGRATRSSVRC